MPNRRARSRAIARISAKSVYGIRGSRELRIPKDASTKAVGQCLVHRSTAHSVLSCRFPQLLMGHRELAAVEAPR